MIRASTASASRIFRVRDGQAVRDAASGPKPGDQPLVGQHAARVAVFGQRAAQFVGVPAGACIQYGYVHRAARKLRELASW